MPRLVEIDPLILEENVFINVVKVFSLFRYYLPLEKDEALYLNKQKLPSPKDALSLLWLKLAQ